VFISQERAHEVGALLQAVDGARHVVVVGPTFDGSKTLITAELTPVMTDHVMRRLMDAGVASNEIDVLQSETVPTIEAGERSWLAPGSDALVWSAVINQARTNARFSAKYAAFMAIAGIIAAFGVMTENAVLIVGAMALAPDLTPVTATVIAAQLTSSLFSVTGQLPSGYELPITTVEAVVTYSLMIVIIALVAGVAGMLAFETKAGSAVGVAISVTTVPAAAYIGVSLGLGQSTNTAEALAMLTVNALMLVIGASAGLVVQLAVAKRRGIVESTAGRKQTDATREDAAW